MNAPTLKLPFMFTSSRPTSLIFAPLVIPNNPISLVLERLMNRLLMLKPLPLNVPVKIPTGSNPAASQTEAPGTLVFMQSMLLART